MTFGFPRRKDERKVSPAEVKERTEAEDCSADYSSEICCNCLEADSYKNWLYTDVMPNEKWPEVSNRHESVSITPNEQYLLDPSVENFYMGLGWSRGAELDASVTLMDKNLKPVDMVWYRELSSECGSVKCSEKGTIATDSSDHCVISVNLANIPLNVHHLVFVLSKYHHSFASSDGIFGHIRMMNGQEEYNGREMFRYSKADISGQSTLMGVWTRKGPLWSFKALGLPATGCTIEHFLKNEANIKGLADLKSWEPDRRKITVTVVKGMGLAAKDKPGLLRKASSDPYYKIKFKDKEFESEYISKTLNPEWKLCPFELDVITEAETAPLEIQIFDYDFIGGDDFMGMIRVPGCAVFGLKPGHHTFWFLAGPTKDEPYAKEEVSGYVLIHFDVREVKSKGIKPHANDT